MRKAVIDFMSKNVFVLDYVPYHSKNYEDPKVELLHHRFWKELVRYALCDGGKLLVFWGHQVLKKLQRKLVKDKQATSGKHLFKKGMLLYSKLRTYLNKVLIADQDGVCTSEIIPIDFYGFVDVAYARIVLMSPYFLSYTASKDYGVKMPRVSTDDMRMAVFPLPPLAEQKRIVERVNAILAECRKISR